MTTGGDSTFELIEVLVVFVRRIKKVFEMKKSKSFLYILQLIPFSGFSPFKWQILATGINNY
jgi:hypothetical protein